MSRRFTGQDLMLDLTPAMTANQQVIGSPNTSEKSSESSCLSSKTDEYKEKESTAEQYRPEVISMVLVGCPRCLMYILLSEVDPKCPQCKSTIFLDFHNQENAKWVKETE